MTGTAYAFWDSSVLVPLCVHQASSEKTDALARLFLPVVWWGSAVEVHSALTRLHRLGEVNDSGKRSALAFLGAMRLGWREIAPSDQLRRLAETLLDRYVLRAADSFQRAASLVWCEERPTGIHFISSDKRLCDAASAAGFSVIQPGLIN